MAYTYTVVAELPRADVPSSSELRTKLEKGSDEDKIVAMRQILVQMLHGDALPALLMDIIRFVLPSRNKQLKKLLHHYWEVVPKLDEQGKLKQEMILVCNAIRNDLQHPNEYVRGSTLRFLAKFREPDLLEPLVPTVRACLDHRHAYVRKNAVVCVASIATNVPDLIPDSAEILSEFLSSETDATCRRNAFVALTRLDRQVAYAYFHDHYAQMATLDSALQLAFVEFVRRDALETPELLPSYLEVLRSLLDQTGAESVVAYDAANALSALTSSPALLAESAATYVRLAVHEPDNNVKVVALSRVAALNARTNASGALGHLVMDVLLVLGTTDIGVRRQALDLAMSLLTSRNVDQVVRLLKRELTASMTQSYDNADEYRQAVISAIHTCATQFQEVTSSVVGLLLEFLGDFNADSAGEVIKFIKEIVEIYPNMRKPVIQQLLGALGSIHSSRAFLGALWVAGEYCVDEDDVKVAWVGLRKALGPLPLEKPVTDEDKEADGAETAEKQPKPSKPRVLEDGTYAMESPLDVLPQQDEDVHPLRRLIVAEGNLFVACALSAALAKLVIRASLVSSHVAHVNGLRAEALLVMASILRTTTDEDAYDRIYGCIQILIDSSEEAQRKFLEEPHAAYVSLLKHERAAKAAESRSELQRTATAVEKPVQFRLLAPLAGDAIHIEQASLEPVSKPSATSQLKQVTQLTGYSDPIYAEALMTVNQFDIVLDVMLFNQTTTTLQNLVVEFFTSGDLKVLDTHSPANVPPMSFHTVRVTVRVSSADSGVIFGNVAYDGPHGSEGTVVILNEIRLNILDYIRPATCTETEFRAMWAEFEWENKVTVSTKEPVSLQDYLRQLMAQTNMACLTPGALDDTDEPCQFLSANLYARSLFGEDALANLSVELSPENTVTGHVRIRARSQGPALSIGDRIAEMERR